MSDEKQIQKIIKSGKDVLPFLAEIYQQLYLVPGTESAQCYSLIVRRGENAPSKDLSHFRMNENDRLELVETPAGPVQVVTLCERQDFELFLHIMANKCNAYDVPATQGASILDGVINWKKIWDHKEVWLKEGNLLSDWGSEFSRFTADRNNYKDALIILSTGPYSNIPASVLGLKEEEWLRRSYTIRKYHECTHFLCRRRFPDRIDAIWDEIVADAAGITAAFGKYDPEMEKVFLGIGENGYAGGRLENYVDSKGQPDSKEQLDALALKAHGLIAAITKLSEIENDMAPFDLAVMLEEKKFELW